MLFSALIEVHGGSTEDRGTSKQKRSTANSSKENLVSFTRLQKSFKCVAGKTSGTLKVLGGSETQMLSAQVCTCGALKVAEHTISPLNRSSNVLILLQDRNMWIFHGIINHHSVPSCAIFAFPDIKND